MSSCSSSSGSPGEEGEEERMAGCLRAVELEYLVARGKGWNQVGAM